MLQIHQWIRAFIGSPAMVILERPMQFLAATWLPKLLQAIDELCAGGAAVLWFTSDPEHMNATTSAPLVRLKLQDEKLQPLVGGTDDE